MSKEVTYKMNSVTGKLSAKIANLEVQLAHEQSAKEAYMKRSEELEEQIKDLRDGYKDYYTDEEDATKS